MGIVRRQSIFSTILIFAGFVIGAVNIFLFYGNEKYFSQNEFGLTRLLPDIALIFSTSCTLGSGIAIIKFYPFYNKQVSTKKNDLPLLGLMACIIGCALFTIILPFTKEFFIRKFSSKSNLFTTYFNLLYPFVIGLAFFNFFEYCFWVIKKTIIPNFFRELLFRLLSFLFIILLIFKIIDFDKFINYYAFFYPFMAIIMFVILVKNNFFLLISEFSIVTKRLYKKIIQFTAFIFMGTLLHISATVIGVIVVASQSHNGLGDVAVFTIATYLITLMDVPLRSMTGIATSIIAQAWKDKDLVKIHEMYKKTALTLLVAGLFIFGLVMLNANNIAYFMGKNYSGIYTIMIILGCSKLIDLGAGLNAQILLSSKYWKIDFYTQLILVFFIFGFNYFLVKEFGVIGSAYANLASFFIYNLIRFIYIKKLFNLQPFSINNIKALVIGLVSFSIIWSLPFILNIYVDSIIKSVLFILLFSSATYFLKISEDINKAVNVYFNKIKSILKITQ